jgi:hypothetical protein
MASRLYDSVIEKLKPENLVRVRPSGITRDAALKLAVSTPTNQQVLEACRAAYQQHSHSVDETTTGSVNASRASDLKGGIAAMHNYNWNKSVAAPQLASPIYNSSTLAASRAAVVQEAFGIFFVGIQANIDVFVGGEGGIGVGFPLSTGPAQNAIGFAYGGWRLSTNIDIGVNINTGMFLEPPSEVAGDFIGIEVSAEPVAEGPEVSFGIHMKPDLSKIAGFSFGIGVALSLIPVSGALVFGKISTTAAA